MKIKENSKGITLIALVITIIVLLILAGVSIAMLTGENGILTKAQTASDETKQKGTEEKVKLAVAGSWGNDGKINIEELKKNLNNVEGIDKATITDTLPMIVKVDGYEVTIESTGKVQSNNGGGNTGGIVTPGIPVTSNSEYTDSNNDVAVIPQGFKVSEKADEQTIDNGLVVIAPDKSEFVWIPVDKHTLCVDGLEGKEIAKVTNGIDKNGRTNYEGKLYDFSGTASKEMINYGQSTTSWREPALLSSYDTDTEKYNTIGLTAESLQEEYNEIIESIKNNGGFYVGRYESSINGDTIASVKGVIPMDATVESANMWYGLYKKTANYAATLEETNIKSTMITGAQYDAMLNWALQGKDKEKVTSIGNGNHNGSIVTTGNETYSNDKINNIFDLEGNQYEWTSEACNNSSRVFRGDGENNSGVSPSNRSDSCSAADPYPNIGCRITLYL